MQKIESKIKKLISEDPLLAKKRARALFQSECQTNNIVFIGAGGLLRKILHKRRYIKETILGICDNDPKKWNKTIEGIQVVSPQIAVKLWGKDVTYVVSIWSPKHPFLELRNQFNGYGCHHVVPIHMFFWKYPNVFLPYYSQSLPDVLLKQKENIQNVLALFQDAHSLRLFHAYLRNRLLLDFDSLEQPDFEYEYFPKDVIRLKTEEVFIDVGAYDGDSIDLFLKHSHGNYESIIAFEPDPATFKKLITRYADLRNVKFYQKAIGNKNGFLFFTADGSVSSSVISGHGTKISATTLDSFLKEIKPTYIKMDIEGSELAALKGIKRILKNDRPMIAVCVYHKPDDIIAIPLFLNMHTIDYAFYLRSHDYDGIQTVLYAVPKERIIP